LPTRLPSSYKLKNGVGKRILKQAGGAILDADIIDRKKQGFGAPMEECSREGDFGRRASQAFICRQSLVKEGFFEITHISEACCRRQIAGHWRYLAFNCGPC
jgi:asparagine synthase (glutamine-hydrolysing)